MAAPAWLWAGGIGALLLATIGWELSVPSMPAPTLPPLPSPAPAVQTGSASLLADAAGATALARPLFATNRRGPPAKGAPVVDRATVDRITGIIGASSPFGEETVAVMQPKDGGQPVTLHAGDRFDGRRIIGIGPAGMTLEDGTLIRPQFSVAQ